MARLTTKQRKSLPSTSFAEPGKRAYPIENESHARAALSMVAAHGTPREQALVRSTVKSRFPHIKVSK